MGMYDDTPVNYATGADNVQQTFAQGAQTGEQLAQSQIQQQQQKIAIQQQQSYAQDMQQAAAGGFQPQDVAAVMLKNPWLADKIAPAAQAMDTAQKTAKLSAATQVMASLYAGDVPTAIKQLNDQADAKEQAGDQAGALQARHMAQLVQTSPKTALGSFSAYLAAIMGPQNFADTFQKFASENRENSLFPAKLATENANATVAGAKAAVAPAVEAANAQKAGAEAKTATADAGIADQVAQFKVAGLQQDQALKAAQFSLDQQKVVDERNKTILELQMKNPLVNPDPELRKTIDGFVDKQTVANQFATKLNDVADQLEQHSDWLTGGIGKALQVGRDAIGLNTSYSQLMSQAALLRGQIVKNVIMQSGGIQRITDSDLRVFADGIPKPTDPPSKQVAFMRGFAKAQQLDGVIAGAQAEWAQQVTHTGTTPRDISVAGIAVPKGTTFNQFILKNKDALLKQALTDQATNSVNNGIVGPWLKPRSTPLPGVTPQPTPTPTAQPTPQQPTTP